jgi:hypothetical protein
MRFVKFCFILFIIFSISGNNNICFAKPNFTPLLINFNGVIADENYIICYGDYGSILSSKDEGITWEQKRIFESGIIKKSYFVDNNIYFFCDDGQVSVWDYNLENELKYKNLNLINFHSFVFYNNYFFLRNTDRLIKVDLNLNLINNVAIDLFNIEILHDRYLEEFQGYIYATINELKVIKYNDNLDIIDTLLLYNKAPNFIFSSYWLHSDGEYLYFYLENSIYKTKDFKTFVKLINGAGELLIPIENSNELLFMGQQSTLNTNINFYINTKRSNGDVDSLGLKYNSKISDSKLRDKSLIKSAIKLNNKLIIVGVSKFIAIAKIEENVTNLQTKIISEMTSFTPFDAELPIFSNDSIFLISGNENSYKKFLNISNDNGVTFQSFIDTSIIGNKLFASSKNIRNINISNDTIYLFGNGLVTKALDSNSKDEKDVLYSISKNNDTIINIISDSKLNNDVFQVIDFLKFNNKYYYIRKYTNQIQDFLVLDSNVNILKNINVLDYDIKKLHIINENDFIFISSENNNQLTSINLSQDKGDSWKRVLERLNSELIYSNKLKIKNIDYLSFVYFDFFNNKLYFEIFNLSTYESILLNIIDLNDENELNIYNSKIYYDSWTYYLILDNRIYYLNESNFDTKNWKFYEFEGTILSEIIIKNKNIFTIYSDKNNPRNIYKIWDIDENIEMSLTENIEEVNYLYTLPPYPNPTVSEVTAKFYWDSRIDIEDNSEIAVFDITGNKVSGKENLILEKLNEWSGNIKWNCVGQPKGTYLIKIQHGNNTKTLKVVVN